MLHLKNLDKLLSMGNFLSQIRSVLSQNIINIPGWTTNRKIVIFESDDWGSIRMPSKEVFERFVAEGMNLTDSDYNRIDNLESNDDLTSLFEILNSFRDHNGNHPSLTANLIVGNPNFLKIKESDFTEYYFEPVTETLKRYPHRDEVEELWKQGNKLGFFHPQFHGREHVNVGRWMNALKKRTPEIMLTFNNETTFSGDRDYSFMEVLDYDTPEDIADMKESIIEGLNIFERIFGYRSKSFVPPCYVWDSSIENSLNSGGVKYLQGLVVQSIPTGSFGNYKKKYHYLGEKNYLNQYFLIRNCYFEPSLTRNEDSVSSCLNRIKIAFNWHKPAIICTHRINFIGSLIERNRNDNLSLLKDLIGQIIRSWPDVEFITSDQLGDVIAGRDESPGK